MFSLIVISQPVTFPGEAHLIEQLFAEGLDCFHLRKPGAEEPAIRTLLDAIPAVYHSRIALHDHHHLAHDYEIHRLHFTEAHRGKTDEAVWRPLRDKGYRLSTSVHELAELNSLSLLFSYTFFSPVFDSISKQEYKSVVSKDFYLRNEQKRVPVIALGGIDAENVQSITAMNFDGAAVLGTIWNEPANAVERWVAFQKAAHFKVKIT